MLLRGHVLISFHRFAEAEAIAKLSHANIGPVHAYGEVRSGGTAFAASQSVADAPGAAALLPPS